MQYQFVNVVLYKLDGELDQFCEVYDFLCVVVDGFCVVVDGLCVVLD